MPGPTRPPHGTHASSGFTLTEMLVSLAILSLAAVMLLGGVNAAGAFQARTDRSTAELDEVAAAQRLLRSRIERLSAVTRSDSSEALVDAIGDEGTLTFFGPPLARAEPDALWRYRIVATATGELMLYWANGLDDRHDFVTKETVGWQPIRLLDGVGRLVINYYGDDPQGPGRRWQTSWNRRPQPPDLIRIRVAFRRGDQRIWPDLIVRPRATVNTVCRIDRLSGRCETLT